MKPVTADSAVVKLEVKSHLLLHANKDTKPQNSTVSAKSIPWSRGFINVTLTSADIGLPNAEDGDTLVQHKKVDVQDRHLEFQRPADIAMKSVYNPAILNLLIAIVVVDFRISDYVSTLNYCQQA